MVNSVVLDSLYNVTDQFISFIPLLVAVIVLLLAGWILGKTLGKIGSKILDKIGLDNLIDRTVLGNMIKKADMSTVGVFDAIIRWFIYFIFALIIIDLLKIQVVANFLTRIIEYIPLIASALVVLIIGLLLVDFLANLIRKILVAAGVDDRIMKSVIGDALKAGQMTGSGIISGIFKLFGYLIFIVAALEILQFTMLTDFLLQVIDYLPHLFVGIIILIVGFLAIDFFMDYIQATMKNMKVEGAEAMLPVLRAFLFLIVILLALDTMLISTSVFYIFLGPLAWGLAIVVAFKWGIKEAMVAYANAKK